MYSERLLGMEVQPEPATASAIHRIYAAIEQVYRWVVTFAILGSVGK